MTTKITELPVGNYDAVRVLRQLLVQAERQEFTDVLVICQKREEKRNLVRCCWSDMDRSDVWWLSGWLISFLRRRYFSGEGLMNERN